MTAGSRLKTLAVAAGALAGCEGGPSPLESPATGDPTGTVRLELGTVIDAQGRVTMPRTVFSPRDTVRLSFARPPDADTVTVRWIRVDGDDAGLVVDSAMQTPDSVGAFSSFAAPASGWALGRFAAEVTIGGKSAGSATFEVR